MQCIFPFLCCYIKTICIVYVGRYIYFFKYCKTNFNFFYIMTTLFNNKKERKSCLAWFGFNVGCCYCCREPSLNGEN